MILPNQFPQKRRTCMMCLAQALPQIFQALPNTALPSTGIALHQSMATDVVHEEIQQRCCPRREPTTTTAQSLLGEMSMKKTNNRLQGAPTIAKQHGVHADPCVWWPTFLNSGADVQPGQESWQTTKCHPHKTE